MTKSMPDEFHEDGTRLFNPSRPHGTVYGDGAIEARWVQDGIQYRGDRLPVGHVAQKQAPRQARAAGI